MCRRPAVSTISTSQPEMMASRRASFARRSTVAVFASPTCPSYRLALIAAATTFNCSRAAGPVNVHRNQQRTVAAILQPVGQLARGRRLTGTLQSGHQDDRRRLRCKFQLGGIFAEGFDQFVADDLDDLLAGRERRHHLLPDRLGLNVVDQVLDDFEVDVGFQQRQTDLFQRLGNVFFGEDGLSAKGLEGALQFFLEILEHRDSAR